MVDIIEERGGIALLVERNEKCGPKAVHFWTVTISGRIWLGTSSEREAWKTFRHLVTELKKDGNLGEKFYKPALSHLELPAV